jgi:hypothetical protein
MIEIPVSIGEFVDKISILMIKKEKLIDVKKHSHVSFELNTLLQKAEFVDKIDIINLKNINQKLWLLEEQIRINPSIEIAVEIFKQNDLRAALKKEINLKYKSQIFEEKQYI